MDAVDLHCAQTGYTHVHPSGARVFVWPELDLTVIADATGAPESLAPIPRAVLGIDLSERSEPHLAAVWGLWWACRPRSPR